MKFFLIIGGLNIVVFVFTFTLINLILGLLCLLIGCYEAIRKDFRLED